MGAYARKTGIRPEGRLPGRIGSYARGNKAQISLPVTSSVAPLWLL